VAAEKKDEIQLDLDAFASEQLQAGRKVTFLGVSYPLKNVYDMSLQEVIDIMTLDRVVREVGFTEQLEHLSRAVQTLLPTMPEEVRRKMSGRQMNLVIGTVFGITEKADEKRPLEGNEALPLGS
jgi:hypothetical protein